jgi:hypothetical protein
LARFFTYSGFRGRGLRDHFLSLPGCTSRSIVMASITELGVIDGELKPFQGAASMQIFNVVPLDNGLCRVRANIQWGSDLNYRISVALFP